MVKAATVTAQATTTPTTTPTDEKIAQARLVQAQMTEAKTANDLRSIWADNFSTLGHKKLGRLLMGVDFDTAMGIKA